MARDRLYSLLTTQMTSIITLRIIMIISANVISSMGSYWDVWPCAKLDWIYKNDCNATIARFPSCSSFYDGSVPVQVVPVHADFNSDADEERGAVMGLTFGMAGWIAMFLHGIGVEIYVCAMIRDIHRERAHQLTSYS
jgi:hypothetical protein